MNLSYGDKGANVAKLQGQLNCVGASRLPRLEADQDFAILTMARVMEYQFQKGWKANGVADDALQGSLASIPSSCQPGAPVGRAILVNLIKGELTAYRDGNVDLHIAPVIGGRPGFESTVGVFQMTSRRYREHTSAKYPTPKGNMDFALFYNGGEALHQGPPTIASHGCIHVPAPFAEQLFDWAGSYDILVTVARLEARS